MSQILNIILTTIAPIILIACLGALLDRTKSIDIRSTSRIIIYLTSPALAFYGIANSSIKSSEFGKLILFTILSMGTITVLAWLITAGLKMDRLTSSAFVLSVSLVNGINYGIPLNEFAFGQPGLERAIVIGVLGGLYASTVGIFLASWGKASIWQALKNVFKVPLAYGALLGLVVNLYHIPAPLLVMRLTKILGGAAVPLMLIMLGIQISRASLQGQWGVIIGASLARLLGGAAVGLLIAFLLGLEGITYQVAIVEAAMPTAVLAVVLATEFNSEAKLVGSTILFSTLLSLLTLPIIILYVK
jgi:predicted permease